MRIRSKLPLLFALATLIFAGIVALVVALTLHGVFLNRLEGEMSRQAQQYAATLEHADLDQISLQEITQRIGAAANARFTVMDDQGWVLADSEADPRRQQDGGHEQGRQQPPPAAGSRRANLSSVSHVARSCSLSAPSARRAA